MVKTKIREIQKVSSRLGNMGELILEIPVLRIKQTVKSLCGKSCHPTLCTKSYYLEISHKKIPCPIINLKYHTIKILFLNLSLGLHCYQYPRYGRICIAVASSRKETAKVSNPISNEREKSEDKVVKE